MLKRIEIQRDIQEALSYIGTDFKTTPYLYVNLTVYGAGMDHICGWIDRNENNIVEGVYLLYYDCIHFYTKDVEKYPIDRLHAFIESHDHRVVMLQGTVGDRVRDDLPSYALERNHIIDMDKVGLEEELFHSMSAGKEDIPDIVDLLMADPEYDRVYERKILLEQMQKRYDGLFSRYYIIKEKHKVVAACSTYGETDRFALVGGVIVHPDYRKRGFAGDVERHVCYILEKENKSRVGFVNVNNKASLALHKKLGAYSIASLAKFVKIA